MGGPYGSHTPFAPFRRDSEESSIHSGVGAIPASPMSPSSSQSSNTNVILYKDANITAYVEKKYPVSSKGHIIIVLKYAQPNFPQQLSLPSLEHQRIDIFVSFSPRSALTAFMSPTSTLL